MTQEQLDTLSARIYRLTDGNFHNDARLEIAQAFPSLNRAYAETFTGLMQMHETIGHMPSWLSLARDECTKTMFLDIGRNSPESAKALWQCL